MAELFSFVDLFSGVGGFKIALENNGGNCLGYSEINGDAITAYCKNFNETIKNNLGDITQIKDLPKHDFLTAGVPCQSWSIAGKNLGFDDDRGQLWNDTIYLLQRSKPKAFIFENVKGLADPRNQGSLSYILTRIKDAGYYADYFLINSHDYGVAQSRVRVYIIGFKNKDFFDKFKLPENMENKTKLSDILNIEIPDYETSEKTMRRDLFGNVVPIKSMSLSSKNGFNDYFLFNDLRNGHTTIHSWDIIDTTERQKYICYMLLKNRRKKIYGELDGNPLSLEHFQRLDSSIKQKELNGLIKLDILKKEEYSFIINKHHKNELTDDEERCINASNNDQLVIDMLKFKREIKISKISINKVIESLKNKGIIRCIETRYDFKNTKISTGLFGVNRIFLPSSDIFPTLVASDTNDYIALHGINPKDKYSYKKQFIEEIYIKKQYRKITRDEACLIQGFPRDFILPDSRARWMKLIGNSVSIPVIDTLCKAILQTGAFKMEQKTPSSQQPFTNHVEHLAL
ncbi:MAG: DNA (cytosine-5-)-methyltransferase [Mariprofundaceae bacterium]|nr:DNA (cytosine-5-)-methyltransferase [Mariprofundaceae bacterium]